jgi:hypothetical protein
MKKQQLIDLVIEEIKKDIASGDVTALDELLSAVPEEYLKGYLPESKKIYKFPRRCDVTGKGMWEGYCFGDGEMYIADKWNAETYAKSIGYDTLEEAYEDDAYYFTDWCNDEHVISVELEEFKDEWYESEYQDGRDAVWVEA